MAALREEAGTPTDSDSLGDGSGGEPQAGTFSDAGHQLRPNPHQGGRGHTGVQGPQEVPHVVHPLHVGPLLQAVHHSGPVAGLVTLHVGVHGEAEPVPGARGHGEPDGVPGPVRQRHAHLLRPGLSAGPEVEAEGGLGVSLPHQQTRVT